MPGFRSTPYGVVTVRTTGLPVGIYINLFERLMNKRGLECVVYHLLFLCVR